MVLSALSDIHTNHHTVFYCGIGVVVTWIVFESFTRTDDCIEVNDCKHCAWAKMNKWWALPVDLPGVPAVPPALPLAQTNKHMRMQSIVWWGWFEMNWSFWNISLLENPFSSPILLILLLLSKSARIWVNLLFQIEELKIWQCVWLALSQNWILWFCSQN